MGFQDELRMVWSWVPETIAFLWYLSGFSSGNTPALSGLAPSRHLVLLQWLYLHDILKTWKRPFFGWDGVSLVDIASHWLLLGMCLSLNESYQDGLNSNNVNNNINKTKALIASHGTWGLECEPAVHHKSWRSKV